MIPTEQSVVSKSGTSLSAGLHTKIMEDHAGKLDYLFPLYDQMNAKAKIPQSITKIVLCFVLLQTYVVSLWPISAFYDNPDSIQTKIVQPLMRVFMFTSFAMSEKMIMMFSIIYSCILIFIMLFVCFQIYYYTTRRAFIKWTLYLTKILIDLMIPIIVHPIAAYTGLCFQALYSLRKSIFYLYMILGFLCYIISVTFMSLNIKLNTRTVILTQSPFLLVKDHRIMSQIIVSSISLAFSFLLDIFPVWFIVALIAVHLVSTTGFVINSISFPFLKLLDNALYSGTMAGACILDVLMIVLVFFPKIFGYLPFIVAIAVIVLTFVVFYFVYQKREAKIKKDLDTKSLSFLSNEEKREYIGDLEFIHNPNVAMQYLYVGLKKQCLLFIDMTLTSYLSKNSNDNNDLLFALIQTTTFFPSETRLLNSLFRLVMNRRDIGFGERFMIYQIHRIKSLRASSSNLDSNALLVSLHEQNEAIERQVKSFWSLPTPNLAFCETLGNSLNSLTMQWKEALYTYPNDSKLSFEYSRFLTEGTTDFDGAIYQQQRGDLIDGGRNFAVDNSFRSFVRMFPEYLMDEFLDIRGNRILKSRSQKDSTLQTKVGSDGFSSDMRSNSTEFTIDAEMEETIGKRLFKYSRMRLVLHHSIGERKSHLRHSIILTSFVTLIAAVIAYAGIYIYVISAFERPMYSITNMDNVAQMRFYEDIAILSLWAYWANATGKISNLYLLGDIDHLDQDFTSYLNLESDYPTQVMKHVLATKTYLGNLLQKLADMSALAIDVYTYSQTIMMNTAVLQTCSNSVPEAFSMITFKDKLAYLLYLNGILAGTDDPQTIYSKNEFCELLMNSYVFVPESRAVLDSFATSAGEYAVDLNSTLQMITIIVSIALACITFIPIFVLILMHIRSTNNILRIMAGLDNEAKEGAKMPIRLDSKDDSLIATTTNGSALSFSMVYVDIFVYIVFGVGSTVLTYLYINNMSVTNSQIAEFNTWYTYAIQRIATSAEAGLEILQVVALTDFTPAFTNLTHNIQIFRDDLIVVMEAHNALVSGNSKIRAFNNYDSVIDKIHFQEACELKTNAQNVHDVYRCAPMTQQIAIFRDLSQEILARPEFFESKVNDETSLNVMHLLTNHLWDSMAKVNTRFILMCQESYETMLTTIYIEMGIALFIAILIIGYTFIFVSRVDLTYSTMLGLIKHITPFHIVSCKPLMDFLLKRNSDESDKSMCVSQSVIHNSKDAIVCTSLNGIVETANISLSSIMGYTSDQLLGQSVAVLFRSDDADKIKAQLEMMVSGQSGSVYEHHFIGISDSSSEITLKTTILGIKNSNSDSISSFVFILSDETELIKKSKEVEAAKTKSEKLLYEILPKDIVVRLNRGEKDISFTIAHASIVFIDIVKFSDYASNLTPQEIMGNLSTVFASFDLLLAKYPSLTKIKLIGDVYMAAGGLFANPEDNPAKHAEDVIRFSLDCLSELDDINLKLSASLEVRIGVNTGGPLLAGVLGTDKPVFDIIGDPINIAARLQSTDIPGKIQISAATKALIENSNFLVEERGEVFLKGKGKQMTYLVVPQTGFLHITGSITLQ